MALTPGTRLGVYEVTAQIGEGGMGQVWRAHDTKLNRDVALKVLPDSFASDPDRLARFTREAQTLASLNHPNIAHIHGLEESGGVRALVMELVEGEDLSQRIAKGAIPIDEALPIAKQIAEALEAAHEQGIIHRDLKPANIKVRPDGTVKVLDFGLAKAMEPVGVMAASASMSPTITSPALMTGAGVILGTAAYMSPEQATGKSVDTRTDVWAFGCVLYEMLTGRPPFQGETVVETLAAILNREPDYARLPVSVGSRMRDVLQRSLDKDRRRRWQAVGDLRYELEAGSAAADAEPPPQTAPRKSFPRRIAPLLIAAGVGAVVVAVLGTAAWRAPAPAEAPSVRFTVEPNQIFQDPGVSEIALSPDGRFLAFVARGDGLQKSLWVQDLRSGERRPLPGTRGAWHPFWSPDSRFIGFYAANTLKKIERSGGAPETIADGIGQAEGTWRGDGTIVFGGRNAVARTLQRVSAAGGAPSLLAAVDIAAGDIAYRFPQFLPDGDHLLYFVENQNPERSGVYVRTLSAGAAKQILKSNSSGVYAPPGYILLTRDQAVLAYPFDLGALQVHGEPVRIGTGAGQATAYSSVSASDNGMVAFGGSGVADVQLTWADRSGRRGARLGDAGPFLQARLSPDERRVALLRDNPQTNTNDIWVLELSTGVASRFSTRNGDPIWSPDGRRMAFYSRSAGPIGDIFQKALGSDTETPLLQSSAAKNTEDWTKDGASIIYRSGGGLFQLPLAGDRKPVPLLPSVSYQRNQFQLSPDGRHIAYTSAESGRSEVWVASFPAFIGRRQVSINGGDVPRWRKDQRELFYLAPDGQMMSVDVTVGPTIEAGAPKSLFQTRIVVSGGFDQYAVTGDGQRFLLLEPPESGRVPPITVITNWTSLLR